MIRLSVLLCTHNPDPIRLSRCLVALANQTLPSHKWELVVVDNANSPPLTRDHFAVTRDLQLRIIVESQLGLTPARLSGIAAAKGDLLVFVDDDNVLASDYLSNALCLMDNHPQIGAAGGILEGEFEHPPPLWTVSYLNLLGIRDFGPRPIYALIYGMVGPWEPIGAGMVIRRTVAQHYSFIATDPFRRSLDRRGNVLGSCGDTDMARCAPDLGYALAYEPSLRLVHLMPSFRLRFCYIFRLVLGIKRSGILLDRIRTGQPLPLRSPLHAALRFCLEALRQFSPRPRLWLLRLAAITGELQARLIRLNP